MKSFGDYLKVILKHEGGYVNDPDDPGGETKYGICKKQFPHLDIKNLTVEQASKIYFESYWLPMNLDKIDNELLKLHLFDMGVNAGTKSAIKLLQEMLGITQDGVIGNITSNSIKSWQGNVVADYINARKGYYLRLVKNKPKLNKFLKGWFNRVNNTKFEN
jgi:lysozyme family protein